MKTVYRLTVCLLLVSALPCALADQAMLIDDSTAKEALHILKSGVLLRTYEQCDDLSYVYSDEREIFTIAVRADRWQPNLYKIFINEKENPTAVDLAYLYYFDGKKWKNVAMHLDLSVIEVPEYLPDTIEECKESSSPADQAQSAENKPADDPKTQQIIARVNTLEQWRFGEITQFPDIAAEYGFYIYDRNQTFEPAHRQGRNALQDNCKKNWNNARCPTERAWYDREGRILVMEVLTLAGESYSLWSKKAGQYVIIGSLPRSTSNSAEQVVRVTDLDSDENFELLTWFGGDEGIKEGFYLHEWDGESLRQFIFTSR